MERPTDEQRAFAEENYKLIYAFLKKNALSEDDWYDVVVFGFLNAVREFDPGRGHFSTFAYSCMTNAYLMEMRKRRRRSRVTECSLEEISENHPALEDVREADPDLESDIQTYIFPQLTDRQKKIFRLLRNGYTQDHLARELKASKTTIVSDIKHIRRITQKYFGD